MLTCEIGKHYIVNGVKKWVRLRRYSYEVQADDDAMRTADYQWVRFTIQWPRLLLIAHVACGPTTSRPVSQTAAQLIVRSHSHNVTGVRTSDKGLSMLLIPRTEGVETKRIKTSYS